MSDPIGVSLDVAFREPEPSTAKAPPGGPGGALQQARLSLRSAGGRGTR